MGIFNIWLIVGAIAALLITAGVWHHSIFSSGEAANEAKHEKARIERTKVVLKKRKQVDNELQDNAPLDAVIDWLRHNSAGE